MVDNTLIHYTGGVTMLLRFTFAILLTFIVGCGGSPPEKSKKTAPEIPKSSKIQFETYPPSPFVDGVWESEPLVTSGGVTLTARLFFNDAGRRLGISLKCVSSDKNTPVVAQIEVPAIYQGRENDKIVYDGSGSIQYGTPIAARVITIIANAEKYSEIKGDTCSLAVKKNGKIQLAQEGISMHVQGIITGMEKFSRVYKDE